uniref:Uncharacterized protein n=1 Tax=Tanacetum cinerariifolium TaxID=118510 RepID=A0A6L2K191_TANCI|nr:hypothetical protein [Tanacetum cinerariifolium]
MNDVDDRWIKMIESGNKLIQFKGEMIRQREQATKLSTHTPKPLQCFNSICYDDDDDYDYEESTIHLNEIISQIPPSIAIIPVLPTDFVLILSESEDTFGSDSEYDLPTCDVFSPINVPEGKSVTFSNPLFDSNDDFTSSDDESLSDENVPEDNVLEDLANKDSYDSNLDEPALLVAPLFVFNEDECFDPSDDVKLLLHHDSFTPKMSVASILEGFTNEPPLEWNDNLFDLESKENEWKKILYDAPIDDFMIEDKVFDPGIHKKDISSTYVKRIKNKAKMGIYGFVSIKSA